MVSVRYWNADVLWDLQFASLTDLVEGTDRYMRVGSVANTKASGFGWDELMACCDLFVLIRWLIVIIALSRVLGLRLRLLSFLWRLGTLVFSLFLTCCFFVFSIIFLIILNILLLVSWLFPQLLVVWATFSSRFFVLAIFVALLSCFAILCLLGLLLLLLLLLYLQFFGTQIAHLCIFKERMSSLMMLIHGIERTLEVGRIEHRGCSHTVDGAVGVESCVLRLCHAWVVGCMGLINWLARERKMAKMCLMIGNLLQYVWDTAWATVLTFSECKVFGIRREQCCRMDAWGAALLVVQMKQVDSTICLRMIIDILIIMLIVMVARAISKSVNEVAGHERELWTRFAFVLIFFFLIFLLFVLLFLLLLVFFILVTDSWFLSMQLICYSLMGVTFFEFCNVSVTHFIICNLFSYFFFLRFLIYSILKICWISPIESLARQGRNEST